MAVVNPNCLKFRIFNSKMKALLVCISILILVSGSVICGTDSGSKYTNDLGNNGQGRNLLTLKKNGRNIYEHEQKDDETVQVFKAPKFRGISDAPTQDECQLYCHTNCNKFLNATTYLNEMHNIVRTQRCIFANKNCYCGPKPSLLNSANCQLFCHKNCNSFKLEIFPVQDTSKIYHLMYEANQNVKKCEESKARCDCRPGSNPSLTTSKPKFKTDDKYPTIPFEDDTWLQNTPTPRTYSPRKFFALSRIMIFCVIISLVGAMIVTMFACRYQVRFRPDSYYQRNLGTVIAAPPNDDIGFISVQVSGQPHPRVWSYDHSGGTPFITSLQGSQLQHWQQVEHTPQSPQHSVSPHPTAPVPTGDGLPEYDPPPPYPGLPEK